MMQDGGSFGSDFVLERIHFKETNYQQKAVIYDAPVIGASAHGRCSPGVVQVHTAVILIQITRMQTKIEDLSACALHDGIPP
jgi:hypothetical protein